MSFCIYQYNVFGRAFGLGNIGKSVIAISGAFILKVAFHGGNVFSFLSYLLIHFGGVRLREIVTRSHSCPRGRELQL